MYFTMRMGRTASKLSASETTTVYVWLTWMTVEAI